MRMLIVFVMWFSSGGCQKTIKPDDEAKETGFLKALELISRSYDWSPEEQLPHGNKAHIYKESAVFRYKNLTWAMTLRGKDHFGRWYVNPLNAGGCMANLITANVAMTPCSCVFSWITSYLKAPLNSSSFTPHPHRGFNDITAPFLFVQHTLHTGPSYFVDEDIRYYPIVNRPVANKYCNLQTTPQEMDYALTLLEVETPVIIDNVPAVMPNNIMTESAEEIWRRPNLTTVWTMTLMTYGTRFKLLNEIILAPNRKPYIGQRLILSDELVSFLVKQERERPLATCCCDRVHFNFEKLGRECWKAYLSVPLCNIRPGSPVVTNNGSLIYGIVMNEVLCEDIPGAIERPVELGYLQVLRLGGHLDLEKNGKERWMFLVDELLAVFNSQTEKWDKNKKTAADATQQIFNYTPGLIYYDEDFVPKLIDNIAKRDQKKTRSYSDRNQISGILGFIVSFIQLLFIDDDLMIGDIVF